ncbi:hypothetical protein [Paludibaculum fermentans]|uniref:hypothetical protein n=1 Tax=Paludibaculum fermentans TaxID=1473598 RepID=UPI003EBB465E
MQDQSARNRVLLTAARCLVMASLAVAPMAAQAPDYQWHTFYNHGETAFGSGTGKTVATDILGNVYVAGITHHPENFAPGSPVHAVEAHPSGNYVGFIMKLNSSGGLLWHTFYHATFAAIAVETDGASIYVTGEGQFRTDGLPAPRYNGAVSDLESATFVLKLDSQGQYLWHTEYNRSKGGVDMVIDPSNHNLYITGETLSKGFPEAPLHAADGPSAAPYILALTQEGSYLWHSIWGEGQARGITVDPAGNIFITGQWHNSGAYNVFVAKVGGPNAAVGFGNMEWSVLFGGSLMGYGVATDSAGNLYATGYARPTAANPGAPPLHTDGSGSSTYVAKFNPAGICLWYTLYGGEGYGSRGMDIVLDGLGKVYVAGFKENHPFFGDNGQPSLHDNTQVSGYHGGLFVLALNTNGAYQWHTFYGNSDRTNANSIALDNERSIYVAGGSRFNWLGDNGTLPLVPHDGADSAFVLKLAQAPAAATTTVTSNLQRTYSPQAQNVTLTAAVTSLAGVVAGGQVCFATSGQAIAPVCANVVNGTASAAAVIPAGTAAGNYTLQATFSGTPVFVTSSDSKQLTILQAAPALTWANPAAIQYGSSLGAMQLNATANVPGSFVYTPTAGTVLAVGNGQTLSTVFTPADAGNYSAAAKSVLINVLAASQPSTPAKIVITRTLSRNGSNQVVAVLSVANTGGTAAQNVRLTAGKIGTTAGTPLPQTLGTVAAGAAVTATMTFPGSVGTAGAASTLTISGTYTGGSFTTASRITLP